MTEKDSSNQQEQKPHMLLEDGKLWRRDKNDEWVDATPEPKHTGDPELDALWEMTVSEVDRIAADESEPLHEKAKQVQYEAAAPFRAIAATIENRLGKSLWPNFSRSIFELNQKPWFGKVAPNLAQALGQPNVAQMPKSPVWYDTYSPTVSTDSTVEDREESPADSSEAPDESERVPDDDTEDPSMAQMKIIGETYDQQLLAETREINVNLNKNNVNWDKFLEAARKSSDIARTANTKATWTISVSIVSAAIAVLALLASLLGWDVAS